ncbi:Protease 2 [Pseudovibrio axinellae]|uniref:Protease 2 n=1 Tax=Pseudovibrio axinellae TaxID=989403 RepID=A0A161XGH9_9HYPH|nr:S9 family peptidase [Pseudovibrio axinellae]KZL20948.1 Protease 2 [Pseudovibrio axinellae]SEP81803.1 oligopeptidase B Serine peptidase. MEROPS family S09A [Pseudovibrio axinellae]
MKKPVPPRADMRNFETTHHGITRNEPYAWLRADNWQDVMRDPAVLDPSIREYLEAENAYTQDEMQDTSGLQSTLFDEMKGRIKEDDSSVPTPDGDYAYATKFVEGGQHAKFVRSDRDGSNAIVLVDGDFEAEGKAYFRFGGASHSDDHRLLAWAFDDKGSEYYTLKVRDTSSGKDLEDTIPDTSAGGVWSRDGKYLFYVQVDANHRPSKLFRHKMGEPVSDDVLVYEEQDTSFFVNLGRTQSGRFIYIGSGDHETNEVWLIPADEPLAEPRLVAQRETSIEYSVEDNGDRLLILTNADGAEDFKIVSVPLVAQLAMPGRTHWVDLIDHQPGRLILSHDVYKDYMVWLERIDGLPRIVVHRFIDGISHGIEFDEEAYSLGLANGFEYNTTTISFIYSSMTTPSEVYDYDFATRDRVLRKRQEIPSGHDASEYITRRLMAPSHDGTLVPVSLLYKRSTVLDGTAPCLLYGYGSYGHSIPASFSTNALSLVDRGFVYAIAHIRGGKDKGYAWYKNGRREFKKNTFHDFIASAKFLVHEGFTSHERIVAHGGSAGGMLMGACANMAPESFSAMIAEVPFVDVLTTMLDDSLPLTPIEWPEWGDPIRDKAAYQYIASYSPVDNVQAKAYPAIFALGGLTDPRVTYWEPAKWVATLREKKTNDSLVMLRTNMDAGHGGASGRFDRLKEVALVYAFALKQTGKAS